LKILHHPSRLRATVIAVHGALGCLGAALAQPTDPAWQALTRPDNSVELGVLGTRGSTAKANEFNGITGNGLSALFRLDLSGGGAYDSDDLLRWSLRGLNLGTQSPSLRADYGMQGSWRLGFAYDSLLRQQSDSYRTPYLGVGSANLGLPADWLVPRVPRVNATAPNARGLSPDVTASGVLVAGVLTPPTAAQAATAATLQAADLPAFRNVDLRTRRTQYGLAWGHELGLGWSWSAEVSREHKSGLRAQAAQSRATGGDTVSILPAPVDQDDNKVALGLAFTGQRSQMQLNYEDSLFANRVKGVTWALWADPTTTATLATAPSNRFRKLSLSGSTKLAETTQFVGAAWYSRGSQNEPLLSDTTAPIVPVTSANALVVNKGLSLKALHRVSPKLGFSASGKLDERDNRTPVNIYGYYDNNNAPDGTSPFAYLFPSQTGLGQNLNIAANTPYSRRTRTVVLDADWRAVPGHLIKAAVEDQKISRWCNDTWISCANASVSDETSLRLDWRGNLGESLQARVGLAAQQRRVDYNENSFLAHVPMANQSPSTATGALAGSTFYGTMVALGLTGHGPQTGLSPAAPAASAQAFYFPNNNAGNNILYGNENRISEPSGLRRFNQADRRRDKLRSSLAWDASETFSLQAGIDVNSDHYTDAVYGLQRMQGVALHVDGNLTLSDDLILGLFASHERQRARFAGHTYTANSTVAAVGGATAIDGGCYATIAQRNANNMIDACLDWTAVQVDRTSTLGATLAMKRLLGGKLDLNGGLYYVRGTTDIGFTGGTYVNNPFAGVAGAPNATTAAYFIQGVAMPTSEVRSIELQLAGTWHFAAKQHARVGYVMQRLRTTDWAYEAMQDGGLTQVLPTREQSPQYTVHRIGVSYQHDF
jgi:MtrB/PioB family decaheme-associated outer membrane protein